MLSTALLVNDYLETHDTLKLIKHCLHIILYLVIALIRSNLLLSFVTWSLVAQNEYVVTWSLVAHNEYVVTWSLVAHNKYVVTWSLVAHCEYVVTWSLVAQ